MPRPGAGGAGGGRGLLAAALLLLAGPAASSQLKLAHTGSHVMELSAEDFNQNWVPQYDGPVKFIAVAFYAPWCQQTQKFMPEWEKMGDILHREGNTDFALARVEAELPENAELSNHFKIRGYPYIFYFHKDEANFYARTDYLEMEKLINRGLAKGEAMLDWIKSMTADVFPLPPEEPGA